jgi:hypothetical protein
LVTPRRGAGKLGCLVSLLIFAAVLYFSANIGQVYWRFYQFEDDMRQQVRFAAQRSNDQIVMHLRAMADTLGLPESARIISVRRNEKGIALEADYYEHVELPMYVREFHFHPHADGPL